MRCRGFTLVELVITLVVLSVLALGVSSYLGIGARMYSEAAEREQVLGQSRFVIERMVREIRNAVPNSIYEESEASFARTCLIFRPILFSGIYTKLPYTENGTAMEVLSPNLTEGAVGKLLVVYPTKPDDFQPSSGKAAIISSVSPDMRSINFSSTKFSHQSPEQRFYIAGDEVTYCAAREGADSKIRRNGILMAEGLRLTFNPDPMPPLFKPQVFKVNDPVLNRNAVVNILLQFGSANNPDMFFNYEVHIPNVP